ncbi:MAG: kelch repeat-containing protein, partial [Chitinophagales bacterium]
EYDPSADVWTQKADFGGTARFAGVAFSVGDKGYVGTGYAVNNNFNTADFWSYDPQNNSWLQVASMPVARRYAAGFSVANTGYVGTGVGDAGYLNDFWAYNPITDAWIQKPDFPGEPRYECVAFAVSGYGYIGVGSFAATLYSDFYEYNPESEIWMQKADYPGNGQDACSGFGLKDKGYIGGGSNQQTWFSDFWEWDQLTDVWTAKEDFPGPPRAFGTGLDILTKGYMGMGEAVGYYHDWWEYTPDSTFGTGTVAAVQNDYFIIPALIMNEPIIIQYQMQQPSQLILTNLTGTISHCYSILKGNNKLILPMHDFESGVYCYTVRNFNATIASGKIVVMK